MGAGISGVRGQCGASKTLRATALRTTALLRHKLMKDAPLSCTVNGKVVQDEELMRGLGETNAETCFVIVPLVPFASGQNVSVYWRP